jgi:hypothetical protein
MKLFADTNVKPNLDTTIEEINREFLYLDPTLIQGQDDGKACAKKFSNNGKGVALIKLELLKEAARDILNSRLIITDDLKKMQYINAFTLVANMVDQQRFFELNPKDSDKNNTVVLLLEAANSIVPEYTSNAALSAIALNKHYLGKALRYKDVPVAARLVYLQEALSLAKLLDSKGCTQAEDPNYYQGRRATFELVVCYCLRDLKRYEEAKTLLLRHVAEENDFHKTQALVQLGEISLAADNPQEALTFAAQGQDIGIATNNNVVLYNAKVIAMKAYFSMENFDDAQSIAEEIKEGLNNPTLGLKADTHGKAANEILSQIQDLKISVSP